MKVRETNEIRELSIEELNSATGGLAILKVMGDLVEKNQPCHTKQICNPNTGPTRFDRPF
jgi:hypothetical protein